jgi:hypothetical protein
MTNLLSDPAKVAIKSDIIKTAFVTISARLINRKPFQQLEWVNSTIFTIIGFVLYQIFADLIKLQTQLSQAHYALISDLLKFSSAFFVARVASGGDFTDKMWRKASIGQLLGLTFYHVVISHYFNFNSLYFVQNPRSALIVQDSLKVSSMLFLGEYFALKEVTFRMFRESLSVVMSFCIYDYFFSQTEFMLKP